MKRAILLATVCLLVMLVLAPVALAQETTMGTTIAADLESASTPAILLPGAALLLGSGILTYAILRRR